MEWEWFPVVEGLDWASLVGPAVVAAVVSGIVTTIGFLVNRSTTLATHRERLRADQRLAERKVEADISLAERKVRLDRELADWKRRMELAEQVLADFYKARDIILAARAPFAFAGEGESRPRLPNETEEEARHRDAIYAPFERLSREREFLSELHARRFRFMALFGNEAATPFMPFIKTYNQIGNAARALINDRRDLGDELRTKFETLIGWTSEDEDPVKEELDQAVADMEALCRPVLGTRPV